jgi:trimethylguanosine synthase
VSELPAWLPAGRLLGPGFTLVAGPDRVTATGELDRPAAADVAARLRGVGFGGRALEVQITPPLPRALVRAARTEDARRRRNTTPGFVRGEARDDPEGRMSLTPEALAVAMGLRAPPTVLDAGCGVGGNTIGFARAGCRVTAIERDPRRLAMARHNARVYGVADRVRWIAGDAVDHVRTLPADLLFVDPPWGADWNRARTTLEDLPLLSAILAIRKDRVWAKVPPSFDPATVPGGAPEAWFGEAPGDLRRVKFLLIRL